MRQRSLEGWTKIDEVPFDFERRRVSVLAEKDGERLLIIKGAPEAVLARTTLSDPGDGRALPLDGPSRENVQRCRNAVGLRLPAAGRRLEGDAANPPGCSPTTNATWSWPASASLSIRQSGARPMPFRDSRQPACGSRSSQAITRPSSATSCMRWAPARAPTGAEIAALTEPALIARADVDLFARVSPDQKTRIIRALQSRGHIVGFLGDGVNDAPAIRAAEVGISVDGATDVARAAADMILLDADLGVLAEGVVEGRRTFADVPQICPHGHQFELRQHALDGPGIAGAAVSSPPAGTDFAEQSFLRYV